MSKVRAVFDGDFGRTFVGLVLVPKTIVAPMLCSPCRWRGPVDRTCRFGIEDLGPIPAGSGVAADFILMAHLMAA